MVNWKYNSALQFLLFFGTNSKVALHIRIVRCPSVAPLRHADFSRKHVSAFRGAFWVSPCS